MAGLPVTWTHMVHSPVHSMGYAGLSSHMAHGLQEEASLALSCPPGDALVHAFVHSLALENMTMQAPHAGSRREPGMDSS